MTFKRLFHSIMFALQRSGVRRANYLRKHRLFRHIGKNVSLQSRKLPLYPELISLHDNVRVAADVRFITHDITFAVLNGLGRGKFPEMVGCIEVMDNVFIGYHCTIMPNVRIGENVIIAACSTVTKDLEPNGVYAGTPARRIGSFEDFVVKRSPNPETGEFDYPHMKRNQHITEEEIQRAWDYHTACRNL